jgi:hypothetical protein
MYQEIPPIGEDADTLKQQFTAERHPIKRQRLHMLYLLSSRQATTRVTVAALLGLSRNTIGRWLTLYTTGGLDGLLQVYRPAKRRRSRPSSSPGSRSNSPIPLGLRPIRTYGTGLTRPLARR